jgi:hypothetical protein
MPPVSADGTNVDAVADELYALPPGDFTSVRNERVKQARSAGDRDAATAIGKLRRPSQSAWAVNLLVRERRDLVDQLLELAEALRSAQETLSGEQLRALSAQRHRVVASVVAEARRLAAAAGTRIGDAGERELEATFDAALADPEAAAAVRSGRLESALSYAGLGAPPTDGAKPPALATSPPAREPATRSRTRKDREAEAAEQAARRRAAQEASQQAVTEAEAAATAAEEDLAEARDARDQAETDRDDATQRIQELTEQLEQAQADAAAAATRIREQQRAVSRAEHRVQEAARRLERARAQLEAAGG